MIAWDRRKHDVDWFDAGHVPCEDIKDIEAGGQAIGAILIFAIVAVIVYLTGGAL